MQRVAQIGLDAHRKFSKVTARGEDNRIVWRERLEHGNRQHLRERLRSWPEGTPVILEGTFGWGWLCNELEAVALKPHLASSRKGGRLARRSGHGQVQPHGCGPALRALVGEVTVVGGLVGPPGSSRPAGMDALSDESGTHADAAQESD